MSIAKCGGIQLDGSTLKMVNGIITLDGGNPTSAVVANCGGIRFDATYFKKIGKVITDKEAESVTTELVADCGGLLLDAEYFSTSDGVLSFEGAVSLVPVVDTIFTEQDLDDIEGLFGVTVDELQSDVVIVDTAISGTSKYADEVDTFDMTKGHHFVVLHITCAGADTIKVSMNPTQSKLTTLDESGVIVLQMKDDKSQTVKIVTSKDSDSETTEYSITDMTFAEQA